MDALDVPFPFNMLRIAIGERWIPEPIYFNHLTNYTTFSACLNIILNNRTVVMVTYSFSSIILMHSTRLFSISYNHFLSINF